MKFVKQVCGNCGGTDVLCDAFAEWDHVTQEWVLQNTFDKGSVCEDCDGECSIEEAPLTGDELNEARAFYLAKNDGWLPSDEDTAIEYCDANDLDYTADVPD